MKNIVYILFILTGILFGCSKNQPTVKNEQITGNWELYKIQWTAQDGTTQEIVYSEEPKCGYFPYVEDNYYNRLDIYSDGQLELVQFEYHPEIFYDWSSDGQALLINKNTLELNIRLLKENELRLENRKLKENYFFKRVK